MKRRELITLLGGAAAWPLAARAQQAMPVIGFLHPQSPEGYVEPMRGFRQGLKDAGYVEGENLAVEYRWANNQIERLSALAADLVRRGVAVIAAAGGVPPALAAQAATKTIPIVFAVGDDPVTHGLVASLARPGGNATGFLMFEYGLSGKWLELLKQIAPGVTRAAVLRDPAIASGIGQFAAVQAVAPSLGVELSAVDARDAPEIERAVTAFARSGNGGLIVTASPVANRHRDLIIALAARHRLPAVYPWRYFVTDGGLISYGPDFDRPVPSSGRLRRSHLQGREAGRPAGAGADQVRDGHQPEDRQGARPRPAGDAARARRVIE